MSSGQAGEQWAGEQGKSRQPLNFFINLRGNDIITEMIVELHSAAEVPHLPDLRVLAAHFGTFAGVAMRADINWVPCPEYTELCDWWNAPRTSGMYDLDDMHDSIGDFVDRLDVVDDVIAAWEDYLREVSLFCSWLVYIVQRVPRAALHFTIGTPEHDVEDSDAMLAEIIEQKRMNHLASAELAVNFD